MTFLASLDPKDRRMLSVILGLIVLLLILLAVFTPNEDPSQNKLPSSYLSTPHGAKAAFTLLQQSGYQVERWEQPLAELAPHADAQTVLILAEPYTPSQEDLHAIATILRNGGRVLATGFMGGLALPQPAVTPAKGFDFAACEAQPEGLEPLTGGKIWIVPAVTWKDSDTKARAAYTCAGQPVVVEYAIGKGHVIWWASSTPLENSSITRGQNLELLLNSIGPPQNAKIYWDESLHGHVTTAWDYVHGPVWPLLAGGSIGLALLVIFSYSRRSGPIRALPQAPRTTPIEFLDALGSLYRSTGANSTAVQIAWERFRHQAAQLTGLSAKSIADLNATQIAEALERRFGQAAANMAPDLQAAEEAIWQDSLKPAQALKIVRTLRQHEETLRHASFQSRAIA